MNTLPELTYSPYRSNFVIVTFKRNLMAILILMFNLQCQAQSDSERLGKVSELSRMHEMAYESGFACRYTIDGVEFVFHKYPGGNDFMLASGTLEHQSVKIQVAGKNYFLERSLSTPEGSSWKPTYIGPKHRAIDGLLLQIERVVKSPWTILGTPLHTVLDNPDVRVIGVTDSDSRILVELEFRRKAPGDANDYAKRPFFTDHEHVKLEFDQLEELKLTSVTKFPVGSVRGVDDRVSYLSENSYSVTHSDGKQYQVFVETKDWSDKRELSLSHYGLDSIERAMNNEPEPFGLPWLLLIVGGIAILVSLLFKNRSVKHVPRN